MNIYFMGMRNGKNAAEGSDERGLSIELVLFLHKRKVTDWKWLLEWIYPSFTIVQYNILEEGNYHFGHTT